MYFTADDGVHGRELWASEGTEGRTALVKDIDPTDNGNYYSGPSSLTDVDGTLYFTVDDGTHGKELWKSDGTKSGTVMVKDINPDDGDYYGPSSLTEVEGTLYFTAEDGSHGRELWRSDGTKAGTVLVKDINPNQNSYYSGPVDLTEAGGSLFFTTEDDTHGAELWKSDGTKAGTVLVKDINPNDGYYGGSSPYDLTDVGGTLFFNADDGTHGSELWRSNGRETGTVLVKDINPADGYYGGSDPNDLIDVGGTLFFTADDGRHGEELWKSDGSKVGTVLVRNISPGDGYGYGYTYGPSNLTDFNGTLFFAADDDTHGEELWRSDGSRAGTILVENINPGDYSSNPYSLTGVGATLFFSARDGVHGPELWKTDGTAAGTALVKDIHPCARHRYPASLTGVGRELFLSADDGVHGSELWKSNGTKAGTVLVKDINMTDSALDDSLENAEAGTAQ